MNDYIGGTYSADVECLASAFHSNAGMSGYINGQLLVGTPEPFIDDIAGRPSLESQGSAYEARIVSIDVEGNTAAVKMIEDVLFGMDFVNYFHLLKVDGKWSIVQKLFHHE